MNSTIAPIMTLNLMSCTEPVIPYENNTTISTNTNDTKLSENNDFFYKDGECFVEEIKEKSSSDPSGNTKINFVEQFIYNFAFSLDS